ncbi:DUF956 family protein [Loigolactobacillus bifermentans]|jgi:hypothetical protein|uniref:DUF956 family protein n=1 Tax=Loigolactobacillus bifermentans DSM 20003 TaxID=1423726 RepID=A0A0R1GMV7_9LACO|nr:DUF956 family protein [Loigolactobacillus bifermentans]KRK32642.1 hypothetical protein FC07_GL002074 [Loigolactobacillus bifermentans DSM 20003]QGG60308.1 DUF956 family protein [Loigolactobacillus bifermentans]
MFQSINTTVDLTVSATAYLGVMQGGTIALGDQGFEFQRDHYPDQCVQLPWSEIDFISAKIESGGKKIPRYNVQTKRGVTYVFSSKQPHEVLRIFREHIGAEHVLRAPSMWDVFRNRYRKKKS